MSKTFDDPKYSGPGVWFVIHKQSYLHNGKETAKLIRNIIEEFPCIKCRKHGMEYLKANPIEKSINREITHNGETRKLGLFLWTVLFHNSVNQRLNKPQMSFSAALETIEMEMCSEMCDASL